MDMNNFYKQIVLGLINEFSNGRKYIGKIKKGHYFGPIINDALALACDKRNGEIIVFRSGMRNYSQPILTIHVDKTSLQVITLSNTEESPELKDVQNTVYKICSGHE
jgi:2-hydroxy-3-keto-5-methylthiopentenyl-1-phosphate phosphatase